MKRYAFLLLVTCLLTASAMAQPKDYEWRTPSQNASESMPCGGGDIGMNVWVEQGDILFYLSRSGCFDENNTLLKAGRFRISLSPGLNMEKFRQILHLEEGYIESYEVEDTKPQKTLHITLKYGARNAKVIRGIRRISKLGLRIYSTADELPRVMGGLGTAVISTSKGMMCDRDARKLGIGGEVICYVW